MSINISIPQIEKLNKNIDKLISLEQKDYEYRNKKKEKYQSKTAEKEENIAKQTYNTKYDRESKKSGGIISDFLNFIGKIGTLFAAYKIAEWVANPKNTKKLANILKGFYNIGKFILNFVDGVFWWVGGSISNLLKLGKVFGDFFNGTVGFIKVLVSPLYSIGKIITDTPKTISKAFNGLLEGINKNLGGVAEKSVEAANKTIKQGVTDLAPTQKSEPNPEIFSQPTVPETPVQPQSLVNLTNPDSTKKDINPNLPKLAKGGVVENTSQKNNIKPLNSLLTGVTNNETFNKDIKSIAPKFHDLMKLPFSIIGSSIVGILKSSMKDNPDSSNTLFPLINSIGKMFDVPIGDTKTELHLGKISPSTNNNHSLDKIIGTSNPNIDSVGGEGTFQSSNDTTVRGLLADILNAFISKIPSDTPLPTKSIGGSVSGKGSGWISGSYNGYPVSLNGGKSTSFIGHGSEYVSKHKTNDSSFVIPYDTPATKTNKNLTSIRIKEAIDKGYDVPNMASNVLETDGSMGVNGYSKGGVVSDINEKIASTAEKTLGLYKGIPVQCANSVRNIGKKLNIDMGITDTPADFALTGIGKQTNPARANSFGAPNQIIYDKAKIKRGDIVQWKDTYAGINGIKNDGEITHVGIYLGDGRYWHHSKKVGTRINTGTSGSNGKNGEVLKFAQAVRLLDNNNNTALGTPTTNPTNTTPTPVAPVATTRNIDYGKVGGAFTTLTQMLGLGKGKDIEPIPEQNKLTYKDTPSGYNPVPKVTPLPNVNMETIMDNPDSSGTGKKSMTPNSGSGKKKSTKLKNISPVYTPVPTPPTFNSPSYNPVPKVTPLSTPNTPYKTVPKVTPLPTLSANPINSNTIIGGDVINTANKTVYSTANFNFSSDLHRFTAISSIRGDVTDSIFV
jgi:hypothetical protein